MRGGALEIGRSGAGEEFGRVKYSSEQFPGGVYVGPPPAPTAINDSDVAVSLFVNEWISFRQPGRYRVTAETTRLVTMAQSESRLPMTSSMREITPADAAWAEAQLKQAAARLEIPDPASGRTGRCGSTFQEMKTAQDRPLVRKRHASSADSISIASSLTWENSIHAGYRRTSGSGP